MATDQNNATPGMNLDNIDAIVLLDKSGSMDTKDVKGNSRWNAGKESISAFAEALAEHDDDGITLVFFDDSYQVVDHTTPEKVEEIFSKRSPGGSTMLAAPLKKIIDMFLPAVAEEKDEDIFENRPDPNYVAPAAAPAKKGRWFGSLFGGSSEPAAPAPAPTVRVKTGTRKVKTGNYVRQSPAKQVFICILTDGAAGDESTVINVLRDATKRINSRRDLGLLFVQVGEDSSAEAFLDRLNNNLQGDFDIVAVEKLESLEGLTTEQIIAKAFTE